MKRNSLLLAVLVITVNTLFTQNQQKQIAESYLKSKGEVTLIIKVKNHKDVASLSDIVSLINYDPETKTITAWCNDKQFEQFESKNIPYHILKAENEVNKNNIYNVRPLKQKSDSSSMAFPLGYYPTYSEYEKQMQKFEDDYPNLVDKFSIGTTEEGDKELLFVKISDNVSKDEQEPKLLLTSSIHGDELTGYPMMLSLINHLLTVYQNEEHTDHQNVKHLIENSEIWINPLANPDGAYYNSIDNTSVANARRGNANNIDLNRNYADNRQGAHPDNHNYQLETLHFMKLANENHFVLSANFHGGSELVNYPFDNAYVSEYTHPDGDWFERISVEYAEQAQTASNADKSSTHTYNKKSFYMTADEDYDINPSSGVTLGAEWYRIYGSRQDYMNYYHQCKEITIELSDDKVLPESSLIDYWHYNKASLLSFLTQGTYGFRGIIKNMKGDPVEAKISIINHDAYGSHTVSNLPHGDFYRPINAGTYDILIEAPNYQPEILRNQTITNYETKALPEIFLKPLPTLVSESLSTTLDVIFSSKL